MTKMILCPTRGGQASYPNQDRAIALAQERGAELLFLYVTNVEFLGQTWKPIVVELETELDHMGEFLLAMAQERAQKSGLTAQATVRRGDFRSVLKEVITEYNVDMVVMGSSGKGTGLVTYEYLCQLGEQVSEDCQVEFIVLRAGEVVCTFPAE